jgi:uncharacterized membrane protein (DUF485 family)
MILFGVYLAFYSGFVGLAAFSPETMETTPLAGVNLAIWYGFGLIVAAIVLALVYGWTCGLGIGRASGKAAASETHPPQHVGPTGGRP